MKVVIFEDSRWKYFLPLTLTRSLPNIRLGILTIRERFRVYLKNHGVDSISLCVRPLVREGTRRRSPRDSVACESYEAVFVNARLLITEEILKKILSLDPGEGIFSPSGDTLAFKLSGDHKIEFPPIEEKYERYLSSNLIRRVEDWPCLRGIWEIPHIVGEIVSEDRELLGVNGHWGEIDPRAELVGAKDIVVGAGGKVKAGAVLDAREGPIVLGERVEIGHNAVLEGPIFLGMDSKVKMGAKIWGGFAGGPHVKIGGEIESVVFQGFSNKQHDGFWGHSFVGEWVNIGALSTTSDLKNTYGEITLHFPFGQVKTKNQFVGSFIGDHSKIGIHTMLNSGTIVGVSSNIFGGDFMPKLIPSFVWGGVSYGWEEYELNEALKVAERVKKRRGERLSKWERSLLIEIFTITQKEREAFLTRENVKK